MKLYWRYKKDGKWTWKSYEQGLEEIDNIDWRSVKLIRSEEEE